MRRASACLSVLLLLGVGAACGSDEDPVATGGPSTTAGAEGPGRPTDVVIEIASGGGFVPYGVDFASVPTVVQRDGTVVTGGAITMQYPGPAVMPVVTGHLSPSDLERLLEAARDAGLTEAELDAGQPPVTDTPTTTITVELDGQRHEHEVYALGFGGEGDVDGGGPTGLTAEQRAVRRALEGFVREVADAVTEVADQPFEPAGYQVIAQAVDPAALTGEEPQPNELDWPFRDLPLPTGDGGGCVDVDGQRTAPFAELLRQATQVTVRHLPDTDSGPYRLSVRATLPGDEPCSAAG